MKRSPELFAERMPDIEKSLWYRQRFDACPHFMFFLGDSHISNIQHTKYPFGQRIAYAGFSKNRADWYHSLPELEFTTSLILEAAKVDPHVSKRMIADFAQWQEAFYRDCETLRAVNLAALSGDELLRTYNELACTYTDKLNSSPLIDGFALSTDTLIASKILARLKEKGVEDKFVEYFSVLTAPIFLSFLQSEEIALLHRAQEIRKNPADEESLIDEHQKAYFWIRNNYVADNVLSVTDFKKRLAGYASVAVEKRIAEIEALPKRHLEEKTALIVELSLPAEIQTLLEITDDFNAWQDERKKGTFWATHYFSMLLEEFARRTDYTLEQLKYAFPPEMADVLSKKLSSAELDARIEYCMILWVEGQYDVTTDPALIAKLERIGVGEMTHAREVRGFTASRGKARGPVKVLESVQDVHKVEEGDVIVAVMTRPDYLPAMQKAIAFVTDEGGITCHAAIVAREMKKPCIISTKIATKIFKDGEMIEVDADKGIVTAL